MVRKLIGIAATLVVMTTTLTGCLLCGTECEVTKVCCPEAKTEKVELKGWDVECKQICIPPIQCPWSDPCELTCGEVIAVKKLKSDKIECGEKCVIKYQLVDASCVHGNGQSCQCQSCQSAQACGTTAVPVESSPIQYHPLPVESHEQKSAAPMPVPTEVIPPQPTEVILPAPGGVKIEG